MSTSVVIVETDVAGRDHIGETFDQGQEGGGSQLDLARRRVRGAVHGDAQRVGDAPEGRDAETGQRAVGDLVLRPGANDHAVPPVERDEAGQPSAQLGPARRSGRNGAERGRQLRRFIGTPRGEGAEQVLLVGEVEVEGAVGDTRDPHDVVHPGGLITHLGQSGHGRLEQLRASGLALAAQGAVGPARGARGGGARAAYGHVYSGTGECLTA